MRRRAIQILGPSIGRLAAGLARLSGKRLGLAVMYHRVGDPPGDPAHELVPSLGSELFRAQLRLFRRSFRVVLPSELVGAAARRRRGERIPLTLTFDDDLASHARVSAPLLAEAGLRAGFFLTGASLERPTANWWEQLQAAADRGLLASASPIGLLVKGRGERHPGELQAAAGVIERLPPSERSKLADDLEQLLGEFEPDPGLPVEDVRRLARDGHEIGFHTLRHDYLPLLDDAELTSALTNGRDGLAVASGSDPRAIAYPHGGVDERVAGAARDAGFETGFTVRDEAFNAEIDDPLRVGRVEAPFLSAGHLAMRLARALTRGAVQ